MRNIFIEKSNINFGGETILRTFLENLGIISLKFYKFVFIVCQVEGYRNILKLSCRLLPITSNTAFCKNKKRSGISFTGLLSA